MTLVSLPPSPGTYALILRLEKPAILQIGHLGEFLFPGGDLVYLGSALGPGGLRARLGRHLRGASSPHWHIDALRQSSQVKGFCYTLASKPLECRWTQLLALQPGAWFPAPGFGASDCRAQPRRCTAHLLAFSHPLSATEISQVLEVASSRPVEAVERV